MRVKDLNARFRLCPDLCKFEPSISIEGCFVMNNHREIHQRSLNRDRSSVESNPTSPPKRSQEVPLSVSRRYRYSGMIGLNSNTDSLGEVMRRTKAIFEAPRKWKLEWSVSGCSYEASHHNKLADVTMP